MRRMLLIALCICPLMAKANVDASTIPGSITMTPIKKSIGASYFGYLSTEASDVNIGDASVYSYNLVALSYKLSPRFTAALRTAFAAESAGTRYAEINRPSRSQLADTSIALIDKEPFRLPHAIASKAVYKLILPTDTSWQAAGTYAGLGADFELSKDFGEYGVGYVLKSAVMAQRQHYFLNNDSARKELPTQMAQLEQWVRLTKHFGDRWNISQGLGLKNSFFNGETDTQKERTIAQLLDTTVNISINDNMDLSLGVAQQTELPYSHNWSLYNNTETSYFIATSIWM